jgi:ankyrin repeat protein
VSSSPENQCARCGATPRLIDQLGQSIGSGEIKTFEQLLPKIENIDETFNEIGETPLTLAALNHEYFMVEKLLKRGAKVNLRTKNGYSALMFAALYSKPPTLDRAIKTIRILLAAGADKTLKNADGETAYDLALVHRAQPVADLLK